MKLPITGLPNNWEDRHMRRTIPGYIGIPVAVLVGLGLWAAVSRDVVGGILEARRSDDLQSRRQQIIDDFSALYLRSVGHWESTQWLGVDVWKNPLDLWVFQEVLYETKPDVIIETGTWHGGSALYMATMCDLMGRGKVITVDITEFPNRPQHPRIHYLVGSSTSKEILEQVKAHISPSDRVMVVLDSDHSTTHVTAELKLYAPLVTQGNYLIVEDTNAGLEYHPGHSQLGGGPLEAVENFLPDHPEFTPDHQREKGLLTYNPNGYLVKR